VGKEEKAELLANPRHWILPPFPVFHPDKPDKMRRVLDAAAKNGGVCLNTILDAGPNLLAPLIGVLLRFRAGEIAINADIKEFFPQVAVPQSYQHLLAFYWSAEGEPDLYASTRHIFGATDSPTCALFALYQAAEAHSPEMLKLVKDSFYMDDFYWSGKSVEEVTKVSKELQAHLLEHRFELGKWISNSAAVIESWPVEERANVLKPLGTELDQSSLPAVKALGVAWDCKTDQLTFQTRKIGTRARTVRDVLSILASVYDPLGLDSPYVLKGKQIFQAAWHDKKDWNAILPVHLGSAWSEWVAGLPAIAKLTVPRWYGLPDGPKTLHMFSDASTTGLGCVAYLTAEGHVPMLVTGKDQSSGSKRRWKYSTFRTSSCSVGNAFG